MEMLCINLVVSFSGAFSMDRAKLQPFMYIYVDVDVHGDWPISNQWPADRQQIKAIPNCIVVFVRISNLLDGY